MTLLRTIRKMPKPIANNPVSTNSFHQLSLANIDHAFELENKFKNEFFSPQSENFLSAINHSETKIFIQQRNYQAPPQYTTVQINLNGKKSYIKFVTE